VISERILILAPLGRDGPLTKAALERSGLLACVCRDIGELCMLIAEGAGAAVLTQEALPEPSVSLLARALESEPPWSDLPLVILGGAESGRFSNATFLERPVRTRLLIAMVQAALRARRRQYQVRDLLEELEHSVRSRDQFLAMLGHELRNPLAAIVMASDLLDRKATGETARERNVITRQARNLSRLVDDLLDVARVTRGKIALHLEALDLGELVRRTIGVFSERARVHDLQLVVSRVDEGIVVRGDPLRLEQVLANLLTNAIKYSDRGTTIEVSVEREQGAAALRVKDQGVGMDPAFLPRIFELFTQGPGSLDRAQGGMGIGLTLAQSLVRLHGGSIEAHSEGTGKGSELVVRLPLAQMREPSRPESSGIRTPRPLRVLLVEDRADSRNVLQTALEERGHRVETSGDGNSAVERALAAPPEAMLIDLGLPGRDGFEVARTIRAALGTGVRLIALTGYGQPADRERALAAGFDAFLVKPATVDAVEAALAA
jgi:signal transduction histidine kinase